MGVRAWLHRDVDANTAMATLSGEEGTLVASPHHLIARVAPSAPAKLEYDFARNFEKGHTLPTHDRGAMTITKVGYTKGHGLYAPLTHSSNFYVSGPQMKTSVLASSFAEVARPELYGWAVH